MRIAILLPLVLACQCDGVLTGTNGLLDDGWSNPFPTHHLVGEDGRLALRDLPEGGDTPIPLDRIAWRRGFSATQTAVLRWDGIDPTALPTMREATSTGNVRMIDVDAGRELRCFAELDAYPGAVPPALLVRPLEPLPVGSDIAVVVTTAVMDRPAEFAALLAGDLAPEVADDLPGYPELLASVTAITSLADDVIALAWKFPVAKGTAPLTSALAQRLPSTGHRFTVLRELDAGDFVPPYTWRAAEGTFDVTGFLEDGLLLDLTDDGRVRWTAPDTAHLYVHLPTSVADAPAGSVPVLLFGHGIFSEPATYLDDPDDESRVLLLAEELGAIVVGTTWRGLTTEDIDIPIALGQDFGRLPELTDRLIQAQVDFATLADSLATGDLLSDPVFQGRQGQLLPDPSRISYLGISLGAIEGAVLVAQDLPIDHAVLHVGGAQWSTLLERSSNWAQFELFVTRAIPDAGDRQVLYALSQLWWDAVDPMSWIDELKGSPLLLQESIGDEQVANITTETLARGLGLQVLEPPVLVPPGLDPVAGPLASGSALVQLDPEVEPPPDVNRPAPVTGAHEAPRTWEGTRLQIIDHVTTGAIVHHCGDAPCSATNQGGAE